MSWEVCAPAACRPQTPQVSLTKAKSSKGLNINAAAARKAGLKKGDCVTIERDGSRYRIRKVEPGSKLIRGTLSAKGGDSGVQSVAAAGIILQDGFRVGVADCQCYDGAVVFDALELKGKLPRLQVAA